MIRIILALLTGYLVGSIPWALIVGKLLYKGADIRNSGSGNLGATNAGRVLGQQAFFLVTVLDMSKGLVTYLLFSLFDRNLAAIAGVAVAIGHCYPLFAGFKGGKAVASSSGVVLGMAIVSHDFRLIIIPVLVLITVLLTTRYMSLSSMSAAVSAALAAWIFSGDMYVRIAVTLLAVIIVVRHRSNIQRLLSHTESKFSLKK